MFDVVIPNNNEESLIDEALLLGYGELVLLSDRLDYDYKSSRIKIKKAYMLKQVNEIPKARRNFDYLFAPAERVFFESKVDFIINAEHDPGRDSFHFRRTSLNQVHAKLCKDNGISIVFGFNTLLACRSLSQLHLVLGRMMQNATLVKKHKISNECLSMATNPIMMRSRNILDAFSRVLGLMS